MIWSTASCVERATSVSSMRRMNAPPKWRANAHEYNAVRAVPRCRKPVGDGAMRVRTERGGAFIERTRSVGSRPSSRAQRASQGAEPAQQIVLDVLDIVEA